MVAPASFEHVFKVNEIFESIQGEGPHVGEPSLFIRFSGCNMSCDFCDTDHQGSSEYTESKLLAEIKKTKFDNIVFTGGEPFYSDGFNVFLRRIVCPHCAGVEKRVQVETNGSIAMDGWPIKATQSQHYMAKNPHIIVSPKADNVAGFYYSSSHLYPVFWKILVDANGILPDIIPVFDRIIDIPNIEYRLFFQPVWPVEGLSGELDRCDTRLATASAKAVELAKYWKASVSVQIHKYLEIR